MSTSIFGNSAPKFIADFGGTGEATVLLNCWLTNKDEPVVKELIIESELTAERSIISRGEYWLFSGTVNLFKYGSLAEIRAKFEEIYAWNKTNVVLYKHRDGEPYKDSGGSEVLFYMTVMPKNLMTLDFKDLLVIEFRSLSGVDFSDSSAVRPAVSEISMS